MGIAGKLRGSLLRFARSFRIFRPFETPHKKDGEIRISGGCL